MNLVAATESVSGAGDENSATISISENIRRLLEETHQVGHCSIAGTGNKKNYLVKYYLTLPSCICICASV